MAFKTIQIKDVRKLGGQGKVAEVSYQCDGRDGKAKAWTGDVEGKTELSVEFEKKDGNYGEEVWIKVPKQGRPGQGGGGGRVDPARAENDRERLNLERAKHEDFLRKWDHDRMAEAERQASIASQVIVKAAVDLAIASGKPEPSVVNRLALDLAETMRLTHEQVYDAIASRPLRGRQP